MAFWFIVTGTMELIAWENHRLKLGGISPFESPEFRLTDKLFMVQGLDGRREVGRKGEWISRKNFLGKGLSY